MASKLADYLFPCASKSLFNLDCPVCGFQRSLLLLFEGEFLESFKMYPPLIPSLLYIVILLFCLKKPKYFKSFWFKSYSYFVLLFIFSSYALKITF